MAVVKRRHFISLMAQLPILLLLTNCGNGEGESYIDGSKRYPDYRYRLMVEVDTPEGLKSGSSVIEVSTRVSGEYSIPDPGKINWKIRGEAVTVDLGARGFMFALLRSELSEDWANNLLMSVTKPATFDEIENARQKNPIGRPDVDIAMQRILELTGKHDIPRQAIYAQPKPKNEDTPTYYPIMVMFKDIQDPKSVTKIDPDNLAANFGKGVKLKRITIERTSDPVSTGIEKHLRWLSNIDDYREKKGNPFTNVLPNEIGYLRKN
jgi:hypothetical protein